MTEQGLVSLLEKLVSIPSVGVMESEDPAVTGEARMAEYLAGHLSALGFRIEWEDRASGRPNLIARHGPASPRRTVMFESHMDTVGVRGMKNPFAARIEGGRLYARGSCDTKGPLAAALHAFTPELLGKLAAAGVGIMVVGAMGEETGNIGALRLVERGLGADHAIILEPTELGVVHAHKGACWFEVEVGGVAAHGSNPDRGKSAILGMAHVIEFLQRWIAEDQHAIRNALLGSPTLNIGEIRGGAAVNIVPDRCVISVDRRTLPEEKHEDVLARVEAGLGSLKKQGLIHSFKIRIIKASDAFETRCECELVKRLAASCDRAGVGARLEGAAWHSDAGAFAKTCGEVVVFGPGSIKQAHTVDEFIDLDSLRAGCDVIRFFLSGLLE